MPLTSLVADERVTRIAGTADRSGRLMVAGVAEDVSTAAVGTTS